MPILVVWVFIFFIRWEVVNKFLNGFGIIRVDEIYHIRLGIPLAHFTYLFYLIYTSIFNKLIRVAKSTEKMWSMIINHEDDVVWRQFGFLLFDLCEDLGQHSSFTVLFDVVRLVYWCTMFAPDNILYILIEFLIITNHSIMNNFPIWLSKLLIVLHGIFILIWRFNRLLLLFIFGFAFEKSVHIDVLII